MQTRELARFVAHSQLGDIPEIVQDEAARALVNWLGCALGGCLDPAVDTALDALGGSGGRAQATVLGRGDRTDPLSATLFNALGSTLLDFDDTHLASSIHPSAPVASALFAAAEPRSAGGAEVVHAFILGVEVACRAGLALGDAHYARGWDITGTCGVLGAAAACAKLLGLDSERVTAALGIAATQASGLNAVLGTPTRSLNAAFAARNGLMAALLAEQGFTASEHALEGLRGFLSVLGSGQPSTGLPRSFDASWEITRVAYKPFACGVVLHPVIDACLHLRSEHHLRPSQIAGIGLRVHPDVLEMAGQREPQTGLEGKLSVFHSAAVALIDGAAGVRQYQDDRVQSSRVIELRSRVEGLADSGLSKEEACVEITLRGGRRVERHVRRALGSLERPLTDAELSDKFRGLATEVLATDQAERLLALAWNIRALGDIGGLIRASVPEIEDDPADLPGSPLIPR